MTSPKSHAANQRNAKRSSGPKTDRGKRRSSRNAMQHGLSIPVESSAWAAHLQSLETLLESDGFMQAEANALALCILNFERNLHHQRQRYADVRRDCQHQLPDAVRHLKRASNQLIKLCKGLKREGTSRNKPALKNGI